MDSNAMLLGAFPQINRVAVRIPPFWSDDPEMWFPQVKKQFALPGITKDVTKFNYIAGNLESRYTFEIRDTLTRPPQNNKYALVKTELIKPLGETQEHKMRRLLEREDLVDRNPSCFLRHLRGCAKPFVPDDVLLPFWLGRLPV